MKRNTKAVRPTKSGANPSIETRALRATYSPSRRASPEPCSKTESPPADSRRSRRSQRTRIGKIARLPEHVREQLNRRLQDGEPGDQLLDWLNSLPKARAVLAAQFGGRPISKQNLSDWKQGGFRDWQRAAEECRRVKRLTEQAFELAGQDKESPLSERLAAVLLVELAGVLERLRDESLAPAESWQLLRQMLREVAQMRREDNRAAKLRIEQERWEWDCERMQDEDMKRAIKEQKEELCAPFEANLQWPLLAQAFGGGERGKKMAAYMLEVKHGLRPGTLCGRRPAKSGARGGAERSDRSDRSDRSGEAASAVKPGQAQSSPVKSNQAEGTEETGRQEAGGPEAAEPDQASTSGGPEPIDTD